MTDKEPNACPFCGSDWTETVMVGRCYAIECVDCDGRGPVTVEKAQAVVEWDEAHAHEQ